MEFGKLLPIDRSVAFALGSEDPRNSKIEILNPEFGTSRTKIYLGCPVWTQKEWKGSLYPSTAKASEFLFHYSRVFNSIELNSTHYTIPSQSQVEKWVSEVPSGFRFSPKFLQKISHEMVFSGRAFDAILIKDFCESIKGFRNALGVAFFQLHTAVDVTYWPRIKKILDLIPNALELCIEFRHPSWFYQGHVKVQIREDLQLRNIGMVVTDTVGEREVVHMSVTNQKMMLRFLGTEEDEIDKPRIKSWLPRIESRMRLGVNEICIFAHQPGNVRAKDLAFLWASALSEQFSHEELIVDVHRPQSNSLTPPQLSLWDDLS